MPFNNHKGRAGRNTKTVPSSSVNVRPAAATSPAGPIDSSGQTIFSCPMKVVGTATNIDGHVLGMLVRAKVDGRAREALIPITAGAEPRQVIRPLAAIGVVPPTDSSRLRDAVRYIFAKGEKSRFILLEQEGIHTLTLEGTSHYVAVVGDQVIHREKINVRRMMGAATNIKQAGNIKDWQRAFGPILVGNPLLVTAVCFGLSIPLSTMLGVRPPGLLFAGPSSTGKSTAARLTLSLFQEPPTEPLKWSSTKNGIEAEAAQHRDLPIALDEIGVGKPDTVLDTIYRLSGGTTKARATSEGKAAARDILRTGVFATGEIGLQELAGRAAKLGHEVRLPAIWVREKFGVFSDIGRCARPDQFVAKVDEAIKKCHGTVLPAFIETLVLKEKRMRSLVARNMARLERAVAGKHMDALSAAERRVAAGFALMAVAGELAVEFKILPFAHGVARDAVALAFDRWITHWRSTSFASPDAALRAVRAFFKESGKRRFVPLHSWNETTAPGVIGYRREATADRPAQFLVHAERFKAICGGFPSEACYEALRDAGLLHLPKKGRRELIRMPKGNGARMAFIVIDRRVLFDRVEE